MKVKDLYWAARNSTFFIATAQAFAEAVVGA